MARKLLRFKKVSLGNYLKEAFMLNKKERKKKKTMTWNMKNKQTKNKDYELK